MREHKLDRRLLNEIEERIRRGDPPRDLEGVGDERFRVEVAHVEALRPDPAEDREDAVADLEAKFDRSQAEILELVGRYDAPVTRLRFANSFVTELTMQQIDEVQRLDSVGYVRLVKRDEVTCLRDSGRAVLAPETHDVLGYEGHGVKVAILDSGVDSSHPALAGKVVEEDSTVAGEGVDVPGYHGTHVAGIVASQDAYRSGVAPGADLINVKVLTAAGFGDHAEVELGMERAYELGADVVNMSLGWSHIFHGWECPDGYCTLCRAAQSLVDLGVIVVVAAGNEDNYKETPGLEGDTNLRCPGQCRGVITVGGLQKNLEMYSDSSLGPPSYSDGWTVSVHFPWCWNLEFSLPGEPWITKPDISAPGVDITSTVLGGGWGALTGTSMASPHVAAAAALMLQKSPTLPPQTVKSVLTHTATELLFDRFASGAGLLDTYNAVLHV